MKPRRTLWEQIRDKLLGKRCLWLAKLAKDMDDAANADGYDPNLFLAVCLHNFTSKTTDERAKAYFAYSAAWSAEDRSEEGKRMDAEAKKPTRPALGTVTIGGTPYDVRTAPDVPRDKNGRASRSMIDRTNRVLWISPLLEMGELPGLLARVAKSCEERQPKPDPSAELQPAGKEPTRQQPARVMPGEKLPAEEMAGLAADLQAVEWAMLAPDGWALPAGLPSDVTFHERGPGVPPTIIGAGATLYCPHCAKACRTTHGYSVHLKARHGWQNTPGGMMPPPNEGRAAQ